MGRIIDRFRGRHRETIVCECRRCGTTLDPSDIDDERCPYCGPTDVSCVRFR